MAARTVRNRFSDIENTGLDTGSETKVQQQFAEQCDINNVVTRFKKTGLLQSTPSRSVSRSGPVFGAYPFNDFQDAYLHIQKVKEQFMALPARVRQRFDNNPANIVRFVEDPANAKEALKLGLLEPPEGMVYDENANNFVYQEDLVKQASEPQKAQGSNPDPGANPANKTGVGPIST